MDRSVLLNVKTQSMRNGSFNKILKCQLRYFCARFHSREINPIVLFMTLSNIRVIISDKILSNLLARDLKGISGYLNESSE